MTEMIERVANALWDAYRNSIPANAEMPAWNDEQMGDHLRNSYRTYARAALEALREPTEAMWRAASNENGFVTEEAWVAMIDAALNPPDENVVWKTYIFDGPLAS